MLPSYLGRRPTSARPPLWRGWNSAPHSLGYGALLPTRLELDRRERPSVVVAPLPVDVPDEPADADLACAKAAAVEPLADILLHVPTLQQHRMTRERWSNKLEFLLAVIGFAVDLGNVWRFPYICYRNGGGAFLIPYFVMFLFGGLPLFYMELALGQYNRSGCISIWRKVCPLFKGIGFAICFVSTYIACYYNTIIAWAVYYFFSSFRAEVPWKHCDPAWSSANCTETAANFSNFSTLPAMDYFKNKVLEVDKSSGFENMGSIRPSLALCLLLVFVIVYFALWKGPRSSGKAVWVTATMPYVVLLLLLVRGITLEGAGDGIRYYLTPKFNKLLEADVWIDAATQIFFSLGPGFGVLLALASYNDFHNNCYKDAILTSLVNFFTSFLSGFVIFSTLGHMAHKLNRGIEEVAGGGGPGLIFVVYPQAIATMSGSSVWAVLFFFMLIMLGIDSTVASPVPPQRSSDAPAAVQFGGLEALITAFCDEFPNAIGKRRELFVLALVVYCYVGGLATTMNGGQYLVEFLDHYGVSFSILFIVVIETIAVFWFYGVRRFSADVQEMLGFSPSSYWRVCWTFISPSFITIMFLVACFKIKQLNFEGYSYPAWSHAVGWLIRLSSILCIPIYMCYKMLILKGSFIERVRLAVRAPPKPRDALACSADALDQQNAHQNSVSL